MHGDVILWNLARLSVQNIMYLLFLPLKINKSIDYYSTTWVDCSIAWVRACPIRGDPLLPFQMCEKVT